MENITISSQYEVSCKCGDYDDISVIINQHQLTFRWSQQGNHLVKFIILKFIRFSRQFQSASTLTVIPYSPLCVRRYLVNLGYVSTLLHFVLFNMQSNRLGNFLGHIIFSCDRQLFNHPTITLLNESLPLVIESFEATVVAKCYAFKQLSCTLDLRNLF